MVNHLATGCDRCQRDADFCAELTETCRRLGAQQVPESLTQMALAIFPARVPAAPARDGPDRGGERQLSGTRAGRLAGHTAGGLAESLQSGPALRGSAHRARTEIGPRGRDWADRRSAGPVQALHPPAGWAEGDRGSPQTCYFLLHGLLASNAKAEERKYGTTAKWFGTRGSARRWWWRRRECHAKHGDE